MTSARDRIDEIVRSNDVVLFMKGTELFPQCGFSSRAVAILERLETPFKTVDVGTSARASRSIATGRLFPSST